MKNGSAFSCYVVLCLCLSLNTIAQKTATYYNQTFKIDTLYPATGSTGMNSPWEVVYGPDDSLWVTEAHNYKIWKIHPGNKGARMLLNRSKTRSLKLLGQTSLPVTAPACALLEVAGVRWLDLPLFPPPVI